MKKWHRSNAGRRGYKDTRLRHARLRSEQSHPPLVYTGAKSSSKRTGIERAIEHRAKRAMIDPFEPGNVTNNLDVSVMLYGAAILRVFFTNHDDTMHEEPGITKYRDSEQCVINRSQ